MNKERRGSGSVFLLFPFIMGMIFARNADEESLGLFLQQLKQYGPVVTLVIFIIALLCGTYITSQGKKDYNSNTFQLGVGLLLSGSVGTIASIILMFI